MALSIEEDTITVFKFKTSGVVALCREVLWLVEEEDLQRRNVDMSSARLVTTEDQLQVVFGYLPQVSKNNPTGEIRQCERRDLHDAHEYQAEFGAYTDVYCPGNDGKTP